MLVYDKSDFYILFHAVGIFLALSCKQFRFAYVLRILLSILLDQSSLKPRIVIRKKF